MIVLSPGPGRPEDAGLCIDIVKEFYDKIPILGVCLGHQSICMAFGGVISYASELMHGKSSIISLSDDLIFEGLNKEITVGRYHSLSLKDKTLPKELKVIARSDDGEVMAVKHEKFNVYGLQFHPESILTPDGLSILTNFSKLIKEEI